MAAEITNLADAVRRSAARDPRAPALIAHDSSVTWGELDARIDAVAVGLQALNLSASERVAIALPNVPEFAVAFFAVLRAGLVAVPINPGYTARELRHLLHDSGAASIVATPAVLDAVSTVRADLPALRHAYAVGGDGIDGAPPFALLAEPTGGGGRATVDPTTGGEDFAVLLYTSGTAGAPKGAMLSHRALIANHRQVERVEPPIVERRRRRPAGAAAVPRLRAQLRPRRGRLARRLRASSPSGSTRRRASR